MENPTTFHFTLISIMGRIASITDLPFEQKFLIVSICLSVEYLSNLAVETTSETVENIKKQTVEFVANELGHQISEPTINSLLIKFLDSRDRTF
jgi:hypothetical protein